MKKSLRMLNRYAVVLSLIGLGGMLLISNRVAVANQLNAWKLLPRPERLTELYFSDHAALPTTFSPDTPQTFTFTIHNLEHQTVEYHFVITVYDGASAASKEIESGYVQLEHGSSRDITRTIKIPPISRQLGIRVSLGYTGGTQGQASAQHQSIHYWVTRSEKGAAQKARP